MPPHLPARKTDHSCPKLPAAEADASGNKPETLDKTQHCDGRAIFNGLSKSNLEESPMTQRRPKATLAGGRRRLRLNYTTIAPAGVKALGGACHPDFLPISHEGRSR
jgi:hypothetical protein